MQNLRGGGFSAKLDMPVFRKLIERWRHPNGLVWGMAIGNYGHAGAWTETLGITASMQEMMLQSWDGALRVFPAWPKDLDARFENFRAEGAFLVTAAWVKGRVDTLRILSEKGGECRLYAPWPSESIIQDGKTNAVTIERQEALVRFQTEPLGTYEITPSVP
jgi:hypothetical protein